MRTFTLVLSEDILSKLSDIVICFVYNSLNYNFILNIYHPLLLQTFNEESNLACIFYLDCLPLVIMGIYLFVNIMYECLSFLSFDLSKNNRFKL